MKFIKPFRGVKAGDIYPTEFVPGDECPDDLAGAANALGALEAGSGDADPEKAAPRGKKAEG